MAEILDEDQLEFLREELESWWISPHGNTIWWLGGTDANREGEISFFFQKKVPSLLTMVKGYIVILNLNTLRKTSKMTS